MPATIEELAQDFLDSFKVEGKTTTYAPAHFWARWKKQGRELPLKEHDIHHFLEMFWKVVACAKELDPEGME